MSAVDRYTALQLAVRLVRHGVKLSIVYSGTGVAREQLRMVLTHAQRDALVDDARGDALDAVLCLMQAAWASKQPGWGLPANLDPLEGWIVSA